MKFFSRRGLARNERGATVVEFAILLPLFLAFVLGIIEICVYFFIAGQLQYGVEQASRSIRVGDPAVVGNNPANSDAFLALVCGNINTLMIGTCATNLLVDVRSFASFDLIAYPADPDLDSDGTIEPAEVQYCAGEPSTAVVARVYYRHSTMLIGFLGNIFTAIIPSPPSAITIQSTTTFRTEPYNATGVTCP